MLPRKHSHPIYMQWCKNILAVGAFAFPPYMIWNSFTSVIPMSSLTEIIVIVIMSFFMMIPLLVTAYFFQDIWVDEEGLQIEFLWRKIRVRWADIIEMKDAWGFWHMLGKNHTLIVLVNGLTSFHRAFGVIYGLSIKPGFIIFPGISNYELLKNEIENHFRQIRQKL